MMNLSSARSYRAELAKARCDSWFLCASSQDQKNITGVNRSSEAFSTPTDMGICLLAYEINRNRSLFLWWDYPTPVPGGRYWGRIEARITIPLPPSLPQAS